MFKTNEGTLDRALRILLGIGLIAMAVTGPQVAWGWLGIIPLATGLIGWCPLYTMLGLKTCRIA